MDPLERFAAGDLDAFEMVFRQYQGEVYRWIVRLVRDPAAAEDLTIDTFWRVYRHRSRFDARRPFLPWVRRIATRVAIDHLDACVPEMPLETTPAQPSGPDTVEQIETRAQIELAFAALPARLRVAATLALIEEQPYQEIAEALGVSVSAVKMRVARAVRLLRASLQRMGIRP